MNQDTLSHIFSHLQQYSSALYYRMGNYDIAYAMHRLYLRLLEDIIEHNTPLHLPKDGFTPSWFMENYPKWLSKHDLKVLKLEKELI